MDPTQQLLAIVSVLAVVLVGLTIVVVSILRNQQKAQKQAARRAVEQEKQERNRLQTLVARVDPLARKAEGDEIIATARAEAERLAERLVILDTAISRHIQEWVATELPQLVSLELDDLAERLQATAASHLRATLLPLISTEIADTLDKGPEA